MEPTFTPRPLRFRVWDGETMYYPGRADFALAPSGQFWNLGVVGERLMAAAVTHNDRHPIVALLSTGLYDATGREAFEGDRVRFNTYHEGAGPDTEGLVTWSDENCGFGVEAEGRRWHVAAALHDFGGRVVGHAFEPTPSSAPVG